MIHLIGLFKALVYRIFNFLIQGVHMFASNGERAPVIVLVKLS
jgi:hypothetical protein